MQIKSKKYPNIEYKKGKEIFVFPDETNNLTFIIDVEESLTENDEVMERIGRTLDEVEILEKISKNYLKQCLSDRKNEYFEIISYFMEFHRDELDKETAAILFMSEEIEKLSFIEMVDYLKINRFGNIINGKSGNQEMVLDLSFNPDVTDELMVIYFDLNKNIINIAHES